MHEGLEGLAPSLLCPSTKKYATLESVLTLWLR